MNGLASLIGYIVMAPVIIPVLLAVAVFGAYQRKFQVCDNCQKSGGFDKCVCGEPACNLCGYDGCRCM